MRKRSALLRFFRQVVGLYFRDIERVGHAPGEEVGGRVFVSNHTNALIDPALVMTEAACAISPIAKSTLWGIPGLKQILNAVGAVPLHRRKDDPTKVTAANDDTFTKIAAHLAGGGNILIFPEGTSHSEPHLAPLRTGAARMIAAAAARARADGRDAPITFQAAALEFDEGDKFRSRCLLLWGPVRDFADVPGEGEDKVRAATALMQADLKELLVEGETHAERRLIARVAELLAHDAGDASLAKWNTIGRRVELASQTLRDVDGESVLRVATAVTAYYEELERLGLQDGHVVGSVLPSATGGTMRRVRLALLAPLAIPGMLLYAPPYFVPRLVARRADRDAASTYKLAAGLLVYPLWMGGLVAGSIMFVPRPFKVPAAVLSVVSPFAALAWLDAWKTRSRSASDEEMDHLLELRAAAIDAITAARASAEAQLNVH
jgi:glycerol-3-phosphate O-acyltransferase / dihydroxyacetone phosphate acyltransferase